MPVRDGRIEGIGEVEISCARYHLKDRSRLLQDGIYVGIPPLEAVLEKQNHRRQLQFASALRISESS